METVIFKLTPELKERLQVESQKRGLSMAAYLRLLVFEGLDGSERGKE